MCRLGHSIRGIVLVSFTMLQKIRRFLFDVSQIRHGPCGIPQDLEVERQQDVRSPVYYRLERVQDSKQLTGYIHLKEFNALAKRDLVTGIKAIIFFSSCSI